MQARVRSRGEEVRRFILQNVEQHPGDIVKTTAEKFRISRQAANKHLNHLVAEKALVSQGKTNARTYSLCPQIEWRRSFALEPSLAEDVVWREHMMPVVGDLPGNVVDIWRYGFTEMFNNAIDHSGGSTISVHVSRTATRTDCWIIDNGIGIFHKIQITLGLLDERHAVLELSKGKLTTDPTNHTGEGIFFASRMFDRFVIMAGDVHFSHEFGEDDDWILERRHQASGTAVFMQVNNHTARTTRKVFGKYTSGDDLGFTKTVVPVRLAQYGEDKLVSRSQAKRLLVRVDRFKTVMLDFNEVKSIGEAFADEIFRVFHLQHPEVELIPINTNSEVQQMIKRARATVAKARA